MKALRAMLLLVPMLAFAGWRPVATVPPGVREVQLVDAGLVLTVSSAGVATWPTDGGTGSSLAGGTFTGGGWYAPDCVVGLNAAGSLTNTCATTFTVGPFSWSGFRLLSSPPFAVAISSNGTSDTLYSGSSSPWSAQIGTITGASGFRTVQTRQIAGVDYVAINGGSNPSLFVSVDGGSAATVGTIGTTNGWRDACPLPLNGAPAVLGVTSSSILLIRDYRTPSVITLSSPPGVAPRNVGSSGLASMVTTATGAVLAPIPNPSRLLETWVVRSGPDGGIGGKVHCIDDRECVSSNDAGVIWLWTNDVPPTIAISGPAQIGQGEIVRLVADAGDGDGDPIYVSWDGGSGGLLAEVVDGGDGTQVDFTAPLLNCMPITIDAVVTDGLPGHERSAQLPILVTARGTLQVSSSATSVPAGGGAVSFSAFVDGGCAAPPTMLTWSIDGGQVGTGSSFSFSPPQTECKADGGVVVVTATATWDSGMPTTTTATQQVVVQPWGAPEAPVFDGGTQAAGTTVDWLAQGIDHQCTGASFFPGTSLVWTKDAGGADVTEIPNGLRITAPSEVCSDLHVTGTAYRQINGGGEVSGAGTFEVTIPQYLPPIEELFFTLEGDGGVLFGLLGIDAGCIQERDLSARVTVFKAGVFMIDGGFPAIASSWPWSLAPPGSCSGGTYDVVADLLWPDGGSTGKGAQSSISLPFSQVKVGAQTISQLDVACGSGAHATVALIPEPNACGSSEISWSVTGPSLTTMSGSGESFELQTQALDFSMVGQQLTVEWFADAGAGNTATATHTIDLGVQPFLEVDVKSRPPLRREEEPTTLLISIHNTTSCAVDGVSVLLPLSGGSAVADFVLIERVKTTGRATDQGLVIDGVSVPADGTTTLELSVRPRLLSTPTVEPVASLNGFVISTKVPQVPGGTGCGCSAADFSLMLLGLLGFFVRRRRE